MGGGRGREEARQLHPHRNAVRLVEAILREAEPLAGTEERLLRRVCRPPWLRAGPEKLRPWVQRHRPERIGPARGRTILAKVTTFETEKPRHARHPWGNGDTSDAASSFGRMLRAHTRARLKTATLPVHRRLKEAAVSPTSRTPKR